MIRQILFLGVKSNLKWDGKLIVGAFNLFPTYTKSLFES